MTTRRAGSPGLPIHDGAAPLDTLANSKSLIRQRSCRLTPFSSVQTCQ
ncbi:hypothetical protein [Methanoculleus chikugoensis]|nr:hypothetical protein [Methanoculleus chikugoensis]